MFQAGKKNYTTISCDHALELLEKYHGIAINRRWFFYCMRDFIDEGLISRKSRYRHGDRNLIRQIPSLITFTIRGLKHLSRNKVAGAFQALKKMIAWLESKDHRYPDQSDSMPNLTMSERNENIRQLKLLFNKVGIPDSS